MTLFRNRDIGKITRAALVAQLPETLPIRKGRNGALYLAGPWGAWYMNCASGQDMLLEQGAFFGPGDTPDPAMTPAVPAAPAAPEPEPEPEPPKKRRSFLDALGDFD